jgi:hypothetical protein
MNISNEAVEAVAEVLERLAGMPPGEELAQEVVKAASPYLAAQTLEDAIAAFPLETIHAPDTAVVWLARRAEAIRAGVSG